MHPFSLNDKELDLIAGAFTSKADAVQGVARYVEPDPTTMALGEEGGGTMPVGEDGGAV